MSLTTIKRPGESRLYEFDFTDLLATGETVSAVSGVTATTPSGSSALTVGSPTLTSPSAFVRISGGTSGYVYLLTCTVTTSASNTLVACGHLRVEAC